MDMLSKCEALLEVAKSRIKKNDNNYVGSFIAMVNILEKIVNEEKQEKEKMCENLFNELYRG